MSASVEPEVSKERTLQKVEDVDSDKATLGNLTYENAEEEPELHARTFMAIGAMFFLNMVQVLALQGPPLVLNTIGADLNASNSQTWIPNGLSLVQAVLSPILASGSDIFAARKFLLVTCTVISFVGSAIAPGSQSIGRLIAAQILIGFGFALVPLAYAIPSEILPRKWRPMAQAFCNVAAVCGACAGPLIIGALTKHDPVNGWRKFYWIQMAFWGVTALGIFFGYKPPKRHTTLDHLPLFQKIRQLDLIGFFLFTPGLVILLTGLNLGGGLYAWSSATVIATIAVGLMTLIAFFVYEWKGTSHPMLNHALFTGGKEGGRSFAILLGLMFVEGILLFAYVIFFPVMVATLFTPDPLSLATRELAYWLTSGVVTVIWGYVAQRLRSIRLPLGTAFLILTAGIAALASIQPGDSGVSIGASVLSGVGFGGPLILIIAGVQLATPRHYIATATAITTSTRAVAATVFTAIYAAAYRNRITVKLPAYVAAAALKAGLPAASLKPFLGAFLTEDTAGLAKIPGVSPTILGAAGLAFKHAQADSIRVVYIIAAPFGLLAVVACFFMSSLGKSMNYVVDHPIEELHAKHEGTHHADA